MHPLAPQVKGVGGISALVNKFTYKDGGKAKREEVEKRRMQCRNSAPHVCWFVEKYPPTQMAGSHTTKVTKLRSMTN
jgi:hypothetical protein